MLPSCASLLVIEQYEFRQSGTSKARVEPRKKEYAAPKLNELAVEKAKVFLRDQAAQGDEEAKDLLNLLRETSA